MDAESGTDPRFSEDRQWWWTGSQWIPASQATALGWQPPQWAERFVARNSARWRWTGLTVLGAALAVAVYGLISGWTVPTSGLASIVAFALFLVAAMSCVALLAVTSHDRRALARNPDSLKVAGGAARGVSWSSLFAIGISLLLFANCSANVTSGDLTKGAATHPSQFWSLAALVILPLVVAIALPAGLAIAASRFAGKGRFREAKRLASAGLWSAGLLAVVALVTAGIAFFGGVSQCFLASTSSSCAAGVGGLMNPTAIGSLIVIVPYLMVMMRALSAASSRPDGASSDNRVPEPPYFEP